MKFEYSQQDEFVCFKSSLERRIEDVRRNENEL